MKILHRIHPCLIITAVLVGIAGCGGSSTGSGGGGGIDAQIMADALHAIIEADRTVYAERVVNRLQDEEQVIQASEHWQDEQALPLPAQMFRMGAELAAEMTDVFTYALLSAWPINSSNAPRTPMKTEGLEAVAADPPDALLRHRDPGRQGLLHGGLCRRCSLASLRHLPQQPPGQPAYGFRTERRHGRHRDPDSPELIRQPSQGRRGLGGQTAASQP